MPDWVATLAGCTSLLLGGSGLWHGGTLLRRGGRARDAIGAPAWLVVVESLGLILLGVALLLDGWTNLVWPAVVLMTVGVVGGIGRRRRAPG